MNTTNYRRTTSRFATFFEELHKKEVEEIMIVWSFLSKQGPINRRKYEAFKGVTLIQPPPGFGPLPSVWVCPDALCTAKPIEAQDSGTLETRGCTSQPMIRALDSACDCAERGRRLERRER